MASQRINSTITGSTLLDRLTLGEDSSSANAQDQLRRSIGQELAWILNTAALSSTRDLKRWPAVRRSVLNYGIDVVPGRSLTHTDAHQLARSIKRVIETYEPRIVPASLTVNAMIGEDDPDHGDVHFAINAVCLCGTAKLPLNFGITWDRDTGQLQVDQ